MTITYNRELITPQRAKQLLAKNAKNQRGVKKGKVRSYARDMLSNNWNPNTGETIKVSTDGEIIDGQNRLLAVVEAGVPIYFDFAYDVPTEAMQVIDTGASRTASDVLRIAGATDRNRAAAVVRWSILWDAKAYIGTGGSVNPTTTEIMERYQNEAGAYNAAASRSADCSSSGLATASPAGTAFYLFSRIDQNKAHLFFDQFVSGAGLQLGDPALTLRNRLVRAKADRINRAEQLALFVRGWNAFREGRILDRIIIGRSELTNETFPQPK